MAKGNFVKLILPIHRMGFTDTVWEADSVTEGGRKMFGYRALFDKETDLTEAKKAVHKVAVEKFGKDYRKIPNFQWPFNNGDRKKDLDGHAGKIYLNLKAKGRPGVVQRDKKTPITQQDENGIYAGCYAQASVTPVSFDEGSQGVKLALLNIIKIKDGKPFSGRKSAEEDFADLEIEDDGSDDPTNYGDDVPPEETPSEEDDMLG